MKKIVYILLLLLLASCKSKQPSIAELKKNESVEVTTRFEKINLKEVNNQKLTKAYNLGKRLLETCNTSRFKVFSKEEATDKVIQNATVEKITKTCQKILMRNGKFIDLNLIDVTQDNETEDLFFRYKIEYEKKYFERELYITINSEGKVSEMKTKELPKKPM
jgi:5'-3' exonuclease